MRECTFETENRPVQQLFESCVTKCRQNLRLFGDDRVLVEGGGYEKIWLETQPMGGEMFAAFDPDSALNNSRLFLIHQRKDGRMPGSIRLTESGRVEPEYNKFQGFCFPWHALNMYYLTGRDPGYLELLYEGLRKQYAYLNAYRRNRENGAFLSFCVYDTGEDHALRYGDSPNAWTDDAPPQGFSVVPMQSMDVTSWVFAICDTLAEIEEIRGNRNGAGRWRDLALSVRQTVRNVFWDAGRGAAFDRDAGGQVLPQLIHNSLRCMYWGSFDSDMAETFVKRHLLNPNEFWTPMPLPSVAVSDPAFRNAPENNWSGQCEGLTFQRSILALERYGMFSTVTALGERFLNGLIRGGYVYTQQFDPFTGEPSRVGLTSHAPLKPGDEEPFQDAYGPTMLAALEFLAHRTGVDVERENVIFSAVGGERFTFEREALGHVFLLRSDGETAVFSVDGRRTGSFPTGNRLVYSVRDGETKTVQAIENGWTHGSVP